MICDKTKYASQNEASQAIRGVSVKYKQSFRSYHCDDCGGWHIHSVKEKKLRPLKDWQEPDHYEKPFQFPKVNPNQVGSSKQKSIETSGRIMSKEQANALRLKISAALQLNQIEPAQFR